jgi:lysophospholipase L1-like esterase
MDAGNPVTRTSPSRGKYVAFALVSLILSALVATLALLLVDVYLHRKFASFAAVNVWGYRGPIAPRKAPGALRIVVLGGSTAFGYGVPNEESIPALLDRALKASAARSGPGQVDVVNLAYNNEGAYAFRLNLEDYRYLDYDLAVLYTGYNDLGGPNTTAFRRSSPIFRLTGYMPILPTILAEKAMSLRYGGDLEAAYWGRRTAFTPNLAQRAGAAALEAAGRVTNSLERQLGRLSSEVDRPARSQHDEGCTGQWRQYCEWMLASIEYALSVGAKVLVVGQPYVSDGHVAQQAALESMLRQRFANDARIRVVNLGRLIDVRDSSLAYDGMHLTLSGNRRVAEAMAPAILQMLAPAR